MRVQNHINSPDGTQYLYEAEIRGQQLSEREKLLVQLGGKCITQDCQIKDFDFLNIDHINDDGKIDRERLGAYVYGFYLRHLDIARERLQVVCVKHHKAKSNG